MKQHITVERWCELDFDKQLKLVDGRTLCIKCHRTTDTYGGRVRK